MYFDLERRRPEEEVQEEETGSGLTGSAFGVGRCMLLSFPREGFGEGEWPGCIRLMTDN